MICPSRAPFSELECDKEDTWTAHMSLRHRNNEAQMEWLFTAEDLQRWGVDLRGKRAKPGRPSGSEEDTQLDTGGLAEDEGTSVEELPADLEQSNEDLQSADSGGDSESE